MKKFVLGAVSMIFLTQSAFAEETADKKTITGPMAKDFIDALYHAGVRDVAHRFGALNFQADKIDCKAPATADAAATCAIDFNGNKLVPAEGPAKVLYQALKQNGAAHVVAKNVTCSRPVVPTANGNCKFTVGE